MFDTLQLFGYSLLLQDYILRVAWSHGPATMSAMKSLIPQKSTCPSCVCAL